MKLAMGVVSINVLLIFFWNKLDMELYHDSCVADYLSIQQHGSGACPGSLQFCIFCDNPIVYQMMSHPSVLITPLIHHKPQ